MTKEYTPHALPISASAAIIHLLKGVIYRDVNEEAWRDLLDNQAAVRDYLQVILLELIFDESEGYAFVRQLDTAVTEGRELPRLVQKRPMGYGVSLLCVLLRKRLAEHDASGGELRLILNRDQMVDMVRIFLPPVHNEARTEDLIDQAIAKLLEYGVLRRMRTENESLFEVRRILRALVDASWLAEMNEKLEVYKKHAAL